MIQRLLRDLRKKMEGVVLKFEEALRSMRSRGASPDILQSLKVTYFGKELPLAQLAHVGSLSTDTVAVEPWDKNALGDIELAVRNSELSLSVVNDGKRLLIKFPPLTAETKEMLIKNLKEKAEETKVNLRVLRQETWDQVQSLEKESKVTEDDKYKAKTEFDKLISEFNQKIDKLTSEKEKQIIG